MVVSMSALQKVLLSLLLTLITLFVLPNTAEAATVGGRITNSEGTSMSGVYVFLYFTDTGTWADPAVYTNSITNASGDYWFTIPDGTNFSLFPAYNGSFGGSSSSPTAYRGFDICPSNVKCYPDTSPFRWDYQNQVATNTTNYNFIYTIDCPSGTTYQMLNSDVNWIVEGCSYSGSGTNASQFTNATVTNKSTNSLGISLSRERWQCYLKYSTAQARKYCADNLASPPGLITENTSSSPIPPGRKLSLSSSAAGTYFGRTDLGFTTVNNPTDELGVCGSSQIDYWFNTSYGPLFAISQAARTQDQGHCKMGDFIAENLSTSEPIVNGQYITFNGRVRNIGRDLKYTIGGIQYTIPAALSGANHRFRLDIGNNATWDLERAVSSASMPSADSASNYEDEQWLNAWLTTPGTHRYELCTDYDSSVTEFLGNNNCASSTFTVTVAAPGAFTISSGSTSCNVITPNNTLTWSSAPNVNPTGNPTGDRYEVYRGTNPSGPWTLVGSKYDGTTTYLDNSGLSNSTSYWYRVLAINIGGSIYATEPQGSGTIEAYQVTTLNCNNPSVDLNVTAPGSITNPKSVTLPPSQSFTLTWTITNSPSFCTVSGSWPNPATQRSAASGSSEDITSPSTVGTYQYNIQCTKNPGGVLSNTSTITVQVVNLPTVDLVANNDPDDIVVISPGPAQATLRWIIADATSCTPNSNPTDSTWNSRAISTSNPTGVPTQSLAESTTSYIYSLTCINTNIPTSISGRSVVDSLNITVSATTPPGGTGTGDAPWIQTNNGDVHSNTKIQIGN